MTSVGAWAEEARTRVVTFLAAIGVIKRTIHDQMFADAVQRRYRSDYLTLATTVPEFKVWADLGEHAATRAALAGLAALLTQPDQKPPRRNPRALLAEINRAELARPVIDVDIEGYGVNAVLPALQAFTVHAPELVPMETTAAVADVAYGILGLYCMRWNRSSTERFLQWLMTLRAPSMSSHLPLALPENLQELDISTVLEYLRAVAPGRWSIAGPDEDLL